MFPGKVGGEGVFSANFSGAPGQLYFSQHLCPSKNYLGLSFDFAFLELVSALGVLLFFLKKS